MASYWDRWLVFMTMLYDLLVDLPEGIWTAPIFAEDSKQALKLGKKLYPGCRLAGVVREGEDDHCLDDEGS